MAAEANPQGDAPSGAALLAGFDAGQTHTTCRLAWSWPDGRLETVATGQGPGVCHLAAAEGAARFQAALQQSLAAANPAGLPLAAAGVGASGIEAGSPVQQQGLALAAAALGLPAERLAVSGDERTALRGAFPSGAGILVISGTGCIAVGRDDHGREHRCGGWGWLLDGSGSAMDIGRDGLMLSVAMADGRLARTELQAALWNALGVGSAQELKARVVQPDFGAAGFAALAPQVEALARAGDHQAQAILERSANGLAELVAGVATALQLPEPAVAAVGGAVQHLHAFRGAFATALTHRLPEARLQAPEGDACSGALQMARELRRR
jgi:phenylacetic acid degradation operon negative regulatory protein